MGTGESNHADSENQRYSAPPPSPRFSVLSSFGFIKRSSHRRVDGKTSDDAQSSRRIRPLDHGISHPPPQRRFASKNSGAHLRSVSTPRRDHATRGSVTTARVESGSGAFFRATTRASRSGEASRASVPRSMLGWLLGGRATKEERRTAAIRCATRDSALKQCVVANSKETCDRLAQDLDLCKVRSVGNVRCRYRTRARARARPTRASRRRRRVAPAGVPFLGTPSFSKAPPPSCQLRDLVPTARSSKLAVFPPRDSTGTGGLSRRGRRVLPLRAPRRQPHRQGGRRPRLLETAEEDARVHSAKAGLTRS